MVGQYRFCVWLAVLRRRYNCSFRHSDLCIFGDEMNNAHPNTTVIASVEGFDMMYWDMLRSRFRDMTNFHPRHPKELLMHAVTVLHSIACDDGNVYEVEHALTGLKFWIDEKHLNT